MINQTIPWILIFDESELSTARWTHLDVDIGNSTIFREEIFEIAVAKVERQIADEDAAAATATRHVDSKKWAEINSR